MAASPDKRKTGEGNARSRMSDVARLAGVSMATVSRVLRQPDIVSPSVRARVHEAVERLSYRRNLVAGALASARSQTVGVVIPSMLNSFFAATVEAMEEGLQAAGYQLLTGNTRYSLETEEQIVASMLAWSPAALVVTGCRHSRGTLKMLLDAGIPVVEMWELSANPMDTVVGFNQRAIGARGCEEARLDIQRPKRRVERRNAGRLEQRGDDAAVERRQRSADVFRAGHDCQAVLQWLRSEIGRERCRFGIREDRGALVHAGFAARHGTDKIARRRRANGRPSPISRARTKARSPSRVTSSTVHVSVRASSGANQSSLRSSVIIGVGWRMLANTPPAVA